MGYVSASYLEIKNSNHFLGPKWNRMHKSTFHRRLLKLSEICVSPACYFPEYWKSQVVTSCDMNGRQYISSFKIHLETFCWHLNHQMKRKKGMTATENKNKSAEKPI